MKLKVIAVRDKITEAYLTPNYFHHVGGAVREFGDAVKNTETVFSKHPTHYDLFLLGEWDNETGEYTPQDPPRQLAIGEEQIEG